MDPTSAAPTATAAAQTLHYVYLICKTVPASPNEEGESRVLIKGVSLQAGTFAEMAHDVVQEGSIVWAAASVNAKRGELQASVPELVREWLTGRAARDGRRCTGTHATEMQVHIVRINAMAIFTELVDRFFH
jgi:hypothetical protein